MLKLDNNLETIQEVYIDNLTGSDTCEMGAFHKFSAFILIRFASVVMTCRWSSVGEEWYPRFSDTHSTPSECQTP